MEKNVISSCTDSEEMKMQRLQKKASIMKDTLETQLTKENLHESNCQTAFRGLKTSFKKIFTSVLIKSSRLDGTYSRKDFKAYTGMVPQAFKEIILANFDFIQKYMIESKLHNKEIKQRMNAKKLQIQECKVQEVKASNASSRDKDNSGILSDKGNDPSLENQSNTSGDESSRSRNECTKKSTSRDDTDIRPSYDIEPIAEVDSNTTPDSSDMCNNEFKDDHNDDKHEDERVVLADLIANLKFNIDENKKIQKQLRNANASLTQELKECKSNFEETTRTLREYNSTRDSCLIALKNKEIELEKYKTFLNRTTKYDTLEHAHTELQCLYQHKIKECECLAEKLSKQTNTVSKEVYNELLRSFAKLENHSIFLELALQQCQEQMKNDTICKQNRSTVFLKKHEQYFEIQDLKAQLQDKNIAISELKKLIEQMKGKSVDTNFEKQSILGKLPLQPIRNKPVPYDVNAPGPSRKNPKHVSFQSPKESVGSNDMVHNYYLEEAKNKAQLQKDKALNTKPSVQQSARLPNNTNEPPRNHKPFLKPKDLACPTCKKCIYSANHDECIFKYLSKVHYRASSQKKDEQAHKTTKRYILVEKKSDYKKHDRQIPIGQKFSLNKSSAVYLKTTPPRSGLTWKPSGRIFTYVGLKWIPIK
ncbi:hypothetical protein Tco_0655694 [Tanacetum coccineum]|uniref:Uncharacterized protein n=1 Tax=Tanacetum coccineum TaxID=301880 RepID=A0ABQ4X7T5_9ASTR